MGWSTYAFLAALFGGATAVLAKLGVAGVPSNLATAVRSNLAPVGPGRATWTYWRPSYPLLCRDDLEQKFAQFRLRSKPGQ
jgi:hypothetical protein